MSDNNLFSIELEPPIAPKRVLRDQARFLAELTGGMITAKVESTRGNRGTEDYFNHRFRIRVPQIDYSMTLCEVSHPIDVYPLQVHCEEWIVEKECNDSHEFLTTLSEILNSTETKRRLESLKSLAMAELDQVDPTVSYETPTVDADLEPTPEDVREEPVSSEEEDNSGADEPAEEEVSEDPLPIDAEEGLEGDFDNTIDDYFIEWGEPVELNDSNVDRCPAGPGAAIIYKNESPMFIAYSGDIKNSLTKQLGGKAHSVVKESRKDGLSFVCGSVSSIDEAESTVESIIRTPMFRALMGDEDANDWM